MNQKHISLDCRGGWVKEVHSKKPVPAQNLLKRILKLYDFSENSTKVIFNGQPGIMYTMSLYMFIDIYLIYIYNHALSILIMIKIIECIYLNALYEEGF